MGVNCKMNKTSQKVYFSFVIKLDVTMVLFIWSFNVILVLYVLVHKNQVKNKIGLRGSEPL